MDKLVSLLIHLIAISLSGYTGSAQAIFYDIGVTQLHWITSQDFTNYLGFGFASPGPQVFSLATFMGYRFAGWSGALVGTLGIYTMPVVLAVAVGRYLQTWIKKARTKYFIKSVSLAAAGVLFAISLKIINANHISIIYALIAVSAAIAINKRVSPLLIILAGLGIGLFLH